MNALKMKIFYFILKYIYKFTWKVFVVRDKQIVRIRKYMYKLLLYESNCFYNLKLCI